MRKVATLLLLVLLTGCTTGDPAVPAVGSTPPEPAALEVSVTADEENTHLRMTEPLRPAPVWHPPMTALTDNVPTYTPEPPPAWPRGLGRPRGPVSLERLLQFLASGGSPGSVADVGALWLGTLADGSNGYYLGGMPRPDQHQAFLLRREGEDWLATPICDAMTWFWPGTPTQQSEPTILCGRVEGSGAVLSLQAYIAGRQILNVVGVRDGSLKIQDRDGGPPDLIVSGKHQWLDHKLDPAVSERYTFSFEQGAYQMVSHERAADEVYYLARFLGFVGGHDLSRAAGEMAQEPPGGLAAYLAEHAPDIERLALANLTTDGRANASRIYLHEARKEGPRFWFDFDWEGRIAALGQQESGSQ